jgi:hypothetical protein
MWDMVFFLLEAGDFSLLGGEGPLTGNCEGVSVGPGGVPRGT